MLHWSTSPEWLWLHKKKKKLPNPWELQQSSAHVWTQVSKPKQKNKLTQTATVLQHYTILPSETDRVQSVEKCLGHSSFSLLISLFVTRDCRLEQLQWLSRHCEHSVTREKFPQIPGEWHRVTHWQWKNKGEVTDNPNPPRTNPLLTSRLSDINLEGFSWGSEEAAQYHKIRVWSVEISESQWGVERGFCSLSQLTPNITPPADTVLTLSLFYGHWKKVTWKLTEDLWPHGHSRSLDDFQNHVIISLTLKNTLFAWN